MDTATFPRSAVGETKIAVTRGWTVGGSCQELNGAVPDQNISSAAIEIVVSVVMHFLYSRQVPRRYHASYRPSWSGLTTLAQVV